MANSPAPLTEATAPETYVDTHCHLDGEEFDADLASVLHRAAEAGVNRWINVGFEPDRWQASIDLAATHPGMAYMLGVHPAHAGEWSPGVELTLRHLIASGSPVAIGEIGLDFFRGETNVDQQVAVFREQLAIAREVDLPVVVHMRDAENEILEVLTGELELPVLLFHSFDGTATLTNWVLEHGAYIGVGGLATRSKAAPLRVQIARVPLNRIVLETDSPYLVPNGFKHRRNTPEAIPWIARMIAELHGSDLARIARETTHNAETLFRRLPPS